jgi:hypothetical protein
LVGGKAHAWEWPKPKSEFANALYDFEAPENIKAQPVGKLLPQLPAQAALSSAFMVKNAF